MQNQNCLICTRIEQIKNKTNKYFVQELRTGYIVIGDHQYWPGYTLFLYKNHLTELHQLHIRERNLFLSEMADVAEAVWKAFSPHKLNYELLGNTDGHLHWHIFPRYSNDQLPTKPVW